MRFLSLSRLHPLAQVAVLAAYFVVLGIVTAAAVLTLVAFDPAWGAR